MSEKLYSKEGNSIVTATDSFEAQNLLKTGRFDSIKTHSIFTTVGIDLKKLGKRKKAKYGRN